TDSDYPTLPVALSPVSSYRPATFVVQSHRFHSADCQGPVHSNRSSPPQPGSTWPLPPDISCASCRFDFPQMFVREKLSSCSRLRPATIAHYIKRQSRKTQR